MLRFFEEYNVCKIILDPPLKQEDITQFKNLFNKKYPSWIVEFGRIYSVDTVIINTLYEQIFQHKRDISIITHKNRLNRYLHKLGFKTKFISLIKEDIVCTSDIEVVLIGGSTDSSPKVINILSNIDISNLSVFIVQHAEPDRVEMFDEVLQRYTKHRVCYANDGEKVKKGIIYLARADKHLKISDGRIVLSDEEMHNYSRPSVSVSYESFSSYYRSSLLVIQECGYADDGVDKMQFLKQNGSKLIIQNVDECEAKPMIEHALALKIHDYSFNQAKMIEYLNFINTKTDEDSWIEYLLKMILKIYGYDFRLYQRSMIKRRIDIFMINHDIKNIKDAVGAILFNKSAFKGFFLEVSINVTEFFRRPKSFIKIGDTLKKDYKNVHNIKVWSAGCSSGEEIYSMAILLDGLGMLNKSILYATDFNSVVLEYAKNAIYSNETYEMGKANFLEITKKDSLDNYVTKSSNYITIKEKIKEKTLFFQHNLATDSSFNEFDIIICKNVIIYFDIDLQYKVFKLFYDSLKFGGYLILGESETIHSSFINKFERYEDKYKMFKKVA